MKKISLLYKLMVLACIVGLSPQARAQYMPDQDHPLIEDASQMSDNCVWPGHEEMNGVAKLLDGNHATHFHSDPVGMNINSNDEWIQIDLGRDDLQRIFLEFYGREEAFHDTPSSLVITATNTPDDESTWATVANLTDGFPADVSNAHYVSPCIDMGTTYRYVRMHVKATSTGNPYWNISELQVYPATILTGLQTLQNVVDSVYALQLNFRVGTTPGYVSYADSVEYATTFAEVLDVLSNTSATSAQISEAVASLRNIVATTYAKIIPVTTGNYFIESAYSAFKEQQPQATFAMAQLKDEDYLIWADLDTTNAGYYFNVSRLDNGNYILRNLRDGRYVGMSSGNARFGAALVNFTTDPTAEQILIPVGDGTYYIAAAGNPQCYLHVVEHAEGQGKSGPVEPASEKEVRELWTFVSVDTTNINALRKHEELVSQVNALSDSLQGITLKIITLKAPNGLITEVSQLSENCVWQSNASMYGVDKLIDGNHVTHFHSSANEGKDLRVDDEWLQADLGRDNLSKFVLEFWGRDDADFHDTPNNILITATNTPDDESSWKEIVQLDHGFPGNVQNAHYVSPEINMNAPYRYIRMHVKSTTTGNPYWNISEFQVYAVPVEASENSMYSKNDNVRTAIDEVENLMATAREHIASLTVDGNEMDAINKAMAPVIVEEATQAKLQAVVDYAESLYDKVNSGEEAQYSTVEGMKEAADNMIEAASDMQAKLDIFEATEADAQGLQKTIDAVEALWQDEDGLAEIISYAAKMLDNITSGSGFGQLSDDSKGEALAAAIEEANVFSSPSTAEFNNMKQKVQDAIDAFVGAIVQPVPGKWYYIISATSPDDSSPADGYYKIARDEVRGAALYVLGSDKGIDEGEYAQGNQLRWGMDDIKSKDRDGDVDAIWRFVPAPDSLGKRVYYVQNMRTGWYIGNCNVGKLNDFFYMQSDTTEVPFRLDFVGNESFNLVPLAGGRAGIPISFGDNARQVRGDAIEAAPLNRAAITFEEFEDSKINIDFDNDSARIVTLPFAVADITDGNTGLKAYTLHSVLTSDGANTGIGLKEKSSFAAGEPFILVVGDTTSHSEESGKVALSFATPDASAMPTLLAGDTVNGLIGTLPQTMIKTTDSKDYLFIRSKLYVDSIGAPTKNGVAVAAHTGYIDPALISNGEGEPDAVIYAVNGTFRTEKVNSIDKTKTAKTNTRVDVYTVDGTLIKKGVKTAEAVNGLQKGVYVVGKKKVLVK